MICGSIRGFTMTDPVLDLLKPASPESMRRWRVSTRVNSVLNDDAGCIEEYQPEPMSPQGLLFQQ
jgi:putative SOS response-associated peptidase YedK